MTTAKRAAERKEKEKKEKEEKKENREISRSREAVNSAAYQLVFTG